MGRGAVALADADPAALALADAARRARPAVAVVFGLNGFGLAAWFARVPAARDALDLSPGRLGLLLLAISGGSVLALLTAGLVVHRIGTARAAGLAAVLMSTGLSVVGFGIGTWASAPAVGVGLFLLGYGAGTCEVAMNVQAAAVERRLGRNMMPRFHAAWSLGTVAGALLGAVAARGGFPVAGHLGGTALVALVGTLLAVRSFLPDTSAAAPGSAAAEGSAAADGRAATEGPAATGGPAAADRSAAEPSGAGPSSRASGVLAAWREPRTLLIGALVLVLALTEGIANDWLAVAFVDGYGVSEAAGAAAFGVFVTAMTVGRMFGTIALDRWGRVPVLLATMLVAGAGAATAVLAGWWPLAVAGVALWGLGTALGFPVGMSAAADEEHRAAARVSVVAAIAYTAFLAGPPVVGLLGDRVGTLRALLVIPVLLLPALLLVPATAPPRSTAQPQPR